MNEKQMIIGIIPGYIAFIVMAFFSIGISRFYINFSINSFLKCTGAIMTPLILLMVFYLLL